MWDISGHLYLIQRCLNLFSGWLSIGLTPAFFTTAICSRIFHSCIFSCPIRVDKVVGSYAYLTWHGHTMALQAWSLTGQLPKNYHKWSDFLKHESLKRPHISPLTLIFLWVGGLTPWIFLLKRYTLSHVLPQVAPNLIFTGLINKIGSVHSCNQFVRALDHVIDQSAIVLIFHSSKSTWLCVFPHVCVLFVWYLYN